MPPTADRLMTLPEVAQLTRTPESTLRHWRIQNPPRGPRSTKLGRRVVYREADVMAWLDARFAEGKGEGVPA